MTVDTALSLVLIGREYLEAAECGFLQGDRERGQVYASLGIRTLEQAIRDPDLPRLKDTP